MSKELLIVDDDPVVRHLLGAMLQSSGREISSCASGAEAIAKIEELEGSGNVPALIFLDLQLNDMPGTEVLGRIRSVQGARIPTVMLSASQKEEILRDHPEAEDADGFLSKPFEPEKLQEILSSLLGET